MELQTFITETLCQILDGVNDARRRQGESIIAPPVVSEMGVVREGIARSRDDGRALYLVDFDVAVAAEERREQGARAGISVLGMGGAAGDTNSTNRKENISRIRFKIPIALNGSRNE